MKYINWHFILILFFCCSCTYEKGELNTACISPAVVSFKQDVMPIMNEHCNTSGCHSGSDPAGNLNLEPSVAYAELMDSRSGYVDTINPEYSVLYAQMNSVSNPMPPIGKLDKCTLELILKWIKQKAKNN